MKTRILHVSKRGKAVKAGQLRRRGLIPVIYYGNKQETKSLTADKKELNSLVRKVGEIALFEMAIEDELMPVRLKEVQRDPVTKEIIHADLQDLPLSHKICMGIPLKIEGIKDIEANGIFLQRQLDIVNVEGYATNLPSNIHVYVGNMQPGDVIYIKDLKIKEEVRILDPPDQIVALALNTWQQTTDIEQ